MRTKMKSLTQLLLLLLLLSLLSSTGHGQTIPSSPPQIAEEVLYFRDGSNNIEYRCYALVRQPVTTIFHRTAASSTAPLGGTPANLTSIAVATNVGTATTSAAHGLRVGQLVTVTGATVDTDLNGTYRIATVPLTTTFTFTTVNVANATYNEATLYIATDYTRDSQTVWAIQKQYHTTTFIDRSTWGSLATTPTVVPSSQLACSLKATYF